MLLPKKKKKSKPKLSRHIKKYMKQINRRKTELNKEKEARRARTFTSKTKAPWLDFNRSPQSIYSQPKQD